jgi:tetratricopeptide (TPR) repeat protein
MPEAMEHYQHYVQSTKSGAETYYKMGQAAEALGDKAKAKKHYQSANMFDHPQKYEVSQALERLSS